MCFFGSVSFNFSMNNTIHPTKYDLSNCTVLNLLWDTVRQLSTSFKFIPVVLDICNWILFICYKPLLYGMLYIQSQSPCFTIQIFLQNNCCLFVALTVDGWKGTFLSLETFSSLFFLMFSLLRTSGSPEQLYVEFEILKLPAVWGQYLDFITRFLKLNIKWILREN